MPRLTPEQMAHLTSPHLDADEAGRLVELADSRTFEDILRSLRADPDSVPEIVAKLVQNVAILTQRCISLNDRLDTAHAEILDLHAQVDKLEGEMLNFLP